MADSAAAEEPNKNALSQQDSDPQPETVEQASLPEASTSGLSSSGDEDRGESIELQPVESAKEEPERKTSVSSESPADDEDVPVEESATSLHADDADETAGASRGTPQDAGQTEIASPSPSSQPGGNVEESAAVASQPEVPVEEVVSSQEVTPVKAAITSSTSQRSSTGSRQYQRVEAAPSVGKTATEPVEVVVEDRDPHHINGELTLLFNEIFAEPERSMHSIDCVWRTSERIYSAVKLWTYRILALFCAIPCACVWGFTFAMLSLASIWIWSPWLKAFRILMMCFKTMFDYVMIAFAVPIFEAIGRIFSFVQVRQQGAVSSSVPRQFV